MQAVFTAFLLTAQLSSADEAILFWSPPEILVEAFAYEKHCPDISVNDERAWAILNAGATSMFAGQASFGSAMRTIIDNYAFDGAPDCDRGWDLYGEHGTQSAGLLIRR